MKINLSKVLTAASVVLGSAAMVAEAVARIKSKSDSNSDDDLRTYSMDDDYLCYECGAVMYKADEEVLVCPKCGHSVNIDDYLTEEEDYEDLYSDGSRYDDDAYWHENEEFPGEPEEEDE